MKRIVARRPSPSMVVAFVALTAALSGTSYAALAAKNSVGSAQIRPKAVKNSDLASNAVTSAKVKNRSLRAVDFRSRDRALLKGDKGDTGPAGATGAKGAKGDKGDAGAQGPAGSARAYVGVRTQW